MITRRQITKQSKEESVIDFVILSDDIQNDVESFIIDEERNHALTKYKRGSKSESDHNVMISKFSFKWSKKVKKNKVEMYNMKNLDCQMKFKEMTSNTDFLSSVFESDKYINTVTKRFIKR